MVHWLNDEYATVRVEALKAFRRFQNDAVTDMYKRHLQTDPSVSVRQTILTCLDKLTNTTFLRFWNVYGTWMSKSDTTFT